jgi:hypothetical protein
MTEPVDPFELLRELNPVTPEDVTDAASSGEAARALEEILAGTRGAPRRWRPRGARIPRLRRRTYLLALVPLLGAATAAAWALTQGATKQLTIGCYASANLQAHTVVVPAGSGRTAVDTCRGVWRRGDFGPRPTPTLQACVLPSGAIGVFPSPTQTACTQLHLTPLASTAPPQPTAASALTLKKALVHAFITHRCMDKQHAVAVVEAEIRTLGLAGWHVQINGTFTSGRPCASLAFDEQTQHVLLVPLPKQP